MKKHILIIDDDQDILYIMKEILLDAGHNVTALIEIDDIIGTVTKHEPDLVILDFLLQGINGGELCSQLKKNERTAHIPVVLTSAHSRILDSFEIFKCDEFLKKPFDAVCLAERVYHLLKNNESREGQKEYLKIIPEIVNTNGSK